MLHVFPKITKARNILIFTCTIITELEKLLEIQPASERLSLIGSAYKRKGMVTGNTSEKLSAYSNAAKNYLKAFKTKPNACNLNNLIVMQMLVNIANDTPSKKNIIRNQNP